MPEKPRVLIGKVGRRVFDIPCVVLPSNQEPWICNEKMYLTGRENGQVPFIINIPYIFQQTSVTYSYTLDFNLLYSQIKHFFS